MVRALLMDALAVHPYPSKLLFVPLLNRSLTSLVVDQVDQSLFTIRVDHFFEMQTCSIRLRTIRQQKSDVVKTLTYRIRQLHHLQVRNVAQSIDLSPVHRHTSSSLNITESRSSSGLWVFNEDHLLRFVEVGHMALLVDTTAEITGSSSVSRSATD